MNELTKTIVLSIICFVHIKKRCSLLLVSSLHTKQRTHKYLCLFNKIYLLCFLHNEFEQEKLSSMFCTKQNELCDSTIQDIIIFFVHRTKRNWRKKETKFLAVIDDEFLKALKLIEGYICAYKEAITYLCGNRSLICLMIIGHYASSVQSQ